VVVGDVAHTRAKAAPAVAAPVPKEDEKQRKRREAETRQKRAKTLGPLEKKVSDLEERITALEAAQAKRSTQLSDPEVYADGARRNTLLNEFQTDQVKLEELTGRWEAAAEELEAARRRLDAEDNVTV
jgi:ATP-binding cassette subfamily F protein 3